MKVLHFYKTFFPENTGGVEKVIDQIAQSTSFQGVESKVLALTSEPHESKFSMNGYEVHLAPQSFEIASTPFSLSIFKKFAELVDWADIVHYHFPYPFADMLHLACSVNKPALLTYHSDIIKQKILKKIYKPLMRNFFSKMSAIVATSPNYVETSEILSNLGEKLHIVPIGLMNESYPIPSPERLAYWGNKFGDDFFLFIGILRYYKGLDYLIEAAKNLAAPIVIIGEGEPLETALKEQISNLKLPNIHMLGRLDEEGKVALLTLCTAVILPSHMRSEAFGISLLEGAMFGKPLVSCEIGTGTSYININKETGLVVAPGDPDTLRDAMKFLLENPDKSKLMGHNAKQRFQNLFTAKKMSKAYNDIYDTLL